MKPEKFIEALSDIDEKMVAKAKPFRESETVEPVIMTPSKNPYKPFYAAAASLAVIAAAGGIFMAVRSWSTANAALTPSAQLSSDSTAAEPDWYEGHYPASASIVYKGDFSDVSDFNYPIGVDKKYYAEYEDLAADSLIVVAGTFVDYTHQTSPAYINEHNSYEFASFNTLEITEVLKGDGNVTVGDKIVVSASYAIVDGVLVSSTQLTPMIKGDSWVYFLQKYDQETVEQFSEIIGTETYYPVGDSDGRYLVPGNENAPFTLCENTNGVVLNVEFNQDIYNEIKNKMGYRTPDQDYGQYVYPYDGDYSEITEFNIPNIPLDKHYGSYLELAADSDLVVLGHFIDDPYQDVDPNPDPDIPLGSNIFSRCKFEIGSVLEGNASAGDVVMIQQSCGVYGSKFISTSMLTPMIKGDTWVYFLKDYGNGIYYAVNDSDGRYEVPGRDNAPLHFYDDSKGGAVRSEYFNEEVYKGVKSKLGYTMHMGEFSLERIKVFDVLTDKAIFNEVEFSMEEFPGVTFLRTPDAGNLTATENGAAVTLFSGMPIENIYLYDLNGDGKREICSTVSIGSGIVDSRVMVCDYANKQLYELEERGKYDYDLSMDGDVLTLTKYNNHGADMDAWYSSSKPFTSLNTDLGEFKQAVCTGLPLID